MKSKSIVIAAVLALMAISNPAQAQIKKNVWQGHINIRGNSLLPWISGNVLAFVGVQNPFYKRWIHVIPEYDFHIPNWSISLDGEKLQLNGPYWWRCLLTGDFRHDYNFSLGYSVYWRSLQIPFDAQLGLNYEWRGVSIANGSLAGLHKTEALVPTVGLTWRILGTAIEREDNMNILFGVTASYVSPTNYNDPLYLGSNAVNGGARFGISLGYEGVMGDYDIFSDYSGISKLRITLRYEWDTFDYFNIPGTKGKLGNLILSWGYIF
ncbi:MAG: hypothetical protein J6I49_01575 [Bacteroidales bacterium]|nr:hypothetical protein [Bacteroidales bacterium]